MKTRAVVLQLAITTLFVAKSLHSHAQVANTLLDLGPNTSAYDVMVDPFNPSTGLFVAGDAPGGEIGIILHLDPTQTPANTTVVDLYPGRISQLGFDPNSGALFSVGDVLDGRQRFWQVRRSADQGASWNLAGSNYQLKAGAPAFALGFTADGAGNVFVCGRAYEKAGGNQQWVVRKSSDQGNHWTTFVPSAKGSLNVAAEIQFVPNRGPSSPGGLFAVGRLGSSWIVQRSRDGGTTWTTVDSFSVANNGDAVATAITSDTQGNIFVGGTARKMNAPQGWYVRKSADSGNSWQTILSNFSTGAENVVQEMTVDAANNLWAIGSVNWASVNETWTVLKWSQAGSWTVPIFPYGYGTPRSGGMSVVADSIGNVYGLGTVQDFGGYNHLVLMRTSN